MRFKAWPLEEKPILVFWETTKACSLVCKHCRAEAILDHLPGTLARQEGRDLVNQVAGFGKPSPVIVFTGGDPLMREDIWDLIRYARSLGVPVALAPAATDLLSDDSITRLVELGVSAVSLSLDGPDPDTHDNIRQVRGSFAKTVELARKLVSAGVKLQINTAVMRDNVDRLWEMPSLLRKLGVKVWEVFYLVPVGRAGFNLDLRPDEWEDVTHFLYESSKTGLLVRTVEGPMFRRVSMLRQSLEGREGLDEKLGLGELYHKLTRKLWSTDVTRGEPKVQTSGTRDGMGIVFVSYNGTVYPSGFLPVTIGSVKTSTLPRIYRENTLLRMIRESRFKGRCGECEFKKICGGSRAKAFAYTGDPLEEDPSCPYKPGWYEEELGYSIVPPAQKNNRE